MKGGWKVIQSNKLVYYELFVFTTSSVYIVLNAQKNFNRAYISTYIM